MIFLSGKEEKRGDNYYLTLFIGMGLCFGIIFDQLAIGISLGCAIGILLDRRKK